MRIKSFIVNSLILFISIFIISCCNNRNISQELNINENIEKMLERAKISSVLIKVAGHFEIKEKTSTSSVTEENMLMISGSGIILKQTKNKTYVLTAEHVCNPINEKDIQMFFPSYEMEKYDTKISHKYLIVDTFENSHVALVLASSKKEDICILVSETIELPAIKIAKEEIRTSQRVYNIGYPYGIHQIDYNPIFEGFSAGILFTKNRNTNVFTLPCTNGCSGSMILNDKGELVSMLHSTYSDFKHIILGTMLKDINMILKNGEHIDLLIGEKISKDLEKENIVFINSQLSSDDNEDK